MKIRKEFNELADIFHAPPAMIADGSERRAAKS